MGADLGKTNPFIVWSTNRRCCTKCLQGETAFTENLHSDSAVLNARLRECENASFFRFFDDKLERFGSLIPASLFSTPWMTENVKGFLVEVLGCRRFLGEMKWDSTTW